MYAYVCIYSYITVHRWNQDALRGDPNTKGAKRWTPASFLTDQRFSGIVHCTTQKWLVSLPIMATIGWLVLSFMDKPTCSYIQLINMINQYFSTSSSHFSPIKPLVLQISFEVVVIEPYKAAPKSQKLSGALRNKHLLNLPHPAAVQRIKCRILQNLSANIGRTGAVEGCLSCLVHQIDRMEVGVP